LSDEPISDGTGMGGIRHSSFFAAPDFANCRLPELKTAHHPQMAGEYDLAFKVIQKMTQEESFSP